MRKLVFTAIAAAASLYATGAAAQTNPPGMEGKDWARTTFSITSGASVTITATNLTTDTKNGNTSRIVVTVNGREVTDRTEDRDRAVSSYTVTGNGTYVVEAVCYNHNATAHRCQISTARVPGDIIY